MKFRSKYYDSDSTPEEVFLYEDFEINPSKPKDILEYNQYIFEALKTGNEIPIKVNFRFLNQEKINEAFIKKLALAENKKAFIEDEIIKIDGTINKFRNNKNQFNLLKDKLFIDAYINSYLDNQNIDLSSQVYDPIDLISLLKGHGIAEYKKFLHAQRDAFLDSKKAEKKMQIFGVEHQLLALHFLGIIDEIQKIENDTIASVFLGNLLNRNSQTMREWLGKLATLTKSSDKVIAANIEGNFDIVSNAFQKVGMDKIVRTIEIGKKKIFNPKK